MLTACQYSSLPPWYLVFIEMFVCHVIENFSAFMKLEVPSPYAQKSVLILCSLSVESVLILCSLSFESVLVFCSVS